MDKQRQADNQSVWPMQSTLTFSEADLTTFDDDEPNGSWVSALGGTNVNNFWMTDTHQ